MADGTSAPVVWFREEPKGFVLNVTNGTAIQNIAGSKDTDVWIKNAVRVVLYPTETDLKGERVDCIRIRAPKAGAKLPEPVAEPEPEPEAIDEGYHASDDDVPF